MNLRQTAQARGRSGLRRQPRSIRGFFEKAIKMKNAAALSFEKRLFRLVALLFLALFSFTVIVGNFKS